MNKLFVEIICIVTIFTVGIVMISMNYIMSGLTFIIGFIVGQAVCTWVQWWITLAKERA